MGVLNRRQWLAGAAAAAFPLPSLAQSAPLKLGLMTVKTGPLAAGGLHMERGITAFLKEKDFTLAGRKVELIVADTGGNPAGAKNKANELAERDKVDMIIGPFAAFELLAILDYLAERKIPTLAFAGAEDVTQRRANAYVTRSSYTSAQCLYPMADYAVKTLNLKRAVTVGDDFAFGYEQVGGFQRVFEDGGGQVVKKLWAPLNTPDYTPYIAQIAECDVVCEVVAGSNPLKFTKQALDLGLKTPIIGGATVADDTIVANFGEKATGLINANPYSLDLETEANHRFVAGMRQNFGADVAIGHYAACLYGSGQVIEAALQKTGGNVSDPDTFVAAIRTVQLTQTPRGALSFDANGNAICDIYIRRLEKINGKMTNKTIKTYPKVSQFWTADPKWFLQQPVFSRDYPPTKV